MIKKVVLLASILSLTTILGCTKTRESKTAQVAIGFWESEDPVIAPYLDSIIAEFEKSNPNVKVTRAHYAVEDLHTQFQSASIAGSPPALLLAPSDKAGLIDFKQYVDSAVDATMQDGINCCSQTYAGRGTKKNKRDEDVR